MNMTASVLLLAACCGAQAQWLNYPTPGTPRTRDGKPNLTAPAPRAAHGKPDLSPLRPEFAGIVRQRAKQESPLVHCLPIGLPADDLLPGPFKIIQAPGLTLIRNEYENTFRQIYTDGRKAPADPEPLWLGYSVGRWERHTFIV